jgi:hypothetical protein
MNIRPFLSMGSTAAVLIVGLLSSWHLLQVSQRPAPIDGNSLYLARFDGIKRVLPDRGVVCYVPSPDASFDAKKHYFLAQYALAPLVVRTIADCDPLIGDFSAGATPESIGSQRFIVLQDFGNGVMLLRRNKRP